jgi:hypothetical protein
MLLPSGPANTRCSVCRFDPGGLHVQLRLAPGTGLQSPETSSQNRRYRDLSRQQRPHVPHLNPRKCLQIAGYSSETAKHWFASDCVVGLGGFEPPTRSLYPDVSGEYASHRLPIIARYFLERRTISIGLRHVRRLGLLSGVNFESPSAVRAAMQRGNER